MTHGPLSVVIKILKHNIRSKKFKAREFPPEDTLVSSQPREKAEGASSFFTNDTSTEFMK